jgi:pimeloyl-ACP methyl ester carboxylesterase
MLRDYVNLPGGQLHFRSAGEGPPVLLLHQVSSGSEMYEALGTRLAATGYRAIAMDTRGFGGSDPPEQPDRFDEYPATVIEFLDTLDVREPIPIVGHHNGAAVAVEVAAAHPERVTRLVLVGCPFDANDEEREVHKRRRYAGGVASVTPRLDGSHLLHEWNRLRALSPTTSADLIQREFVATMRAPRYDLTYLARWNYDIASRLPLAHCPALVLAGTKDDLMFNNQPRVVKLLPRGRLREIAGGGVFMLDEQVDEIAPIVLEFLAEAA